MLKAGGNRKPLLDPCECLRLSLLRGKPVDAVSCSCTTYRTYDVLSVYHGAIHLGMGIEGFRKPNETMIAEGLAWLASAYLPMNPVNKVYTS